MASSSPKAASNNEQNPVTLAYMIAYNVAQIMGWCAILVAMFSHLVTEKSSKGLYGIVEPLLQVFQTAAVLEILHCALGLVRSSVMLTGFQVFSRVFLVWGVVYSVPMAQNTIGVTMFLFAWTITEIIRYSFYVFSLIGRVPYPIQWCRYTFFIVLYPIGVSGELITIMQSLPDVKRTNLYSLDLPNAANISFSYYYYLIFVMLSYIPVFPQLYKHMLRQRKKVIGGDSKSKTD